MICELRQSPYLAHRHLAWGEHSGKCCRNSVVLQVTNCWNHHRSAKNDAISKIYKKLLIYLQRTCLLSLGRSIGLQQTMQQTATSENSLTFGKNMCVSARWFASCDDHHILHTGTWLRDDHPGKCSSKSCYTVKFQVANVKTTPIDEENNATAGIQMITRSYLCLRVIGNIVTSPEKDDWLQQTRLRIATAKNDSIWRYFSIFPLQGMHGIFCHASVFLIRPTPTHNNILQVILKISIFGLRTLPMCFIL